MLEILIYRRFTALMSHSQLDEVDIKKFLYHLLSIKGLINGYIIKLFRENNNVLLGSDKSRYLKRKLLSSLPIFVQIENVTLS